MASKRPYSSDMGTILPELSGGRRASRPRSSRAGLIFFLLFLPAATGAVYYLVRQKGLTPQEAGGPSEQTSTDNLLALKTPPPPKQGPAEQPAAPASVNRPPLEGDTTDALGTEPASGPTDVPAGKITDPEPAPETPPPLEDAMARGRKAMRKADRAMQKKDYTGAAQILSDYLEQAGPARYHAEAQYRLGIAARYQRKEEAAQRHWRYAVDTFPAELGGRLAAVALADTLFAAYAGKKPDKSKWESIRNLYSQAMGEDGASFLTAAVRKRVTGNLKTLNDYLVFSPAPVTGVLYYRIRSGDMLYTIARRHGVHHDSIMAMNHISNPGTIRAGKRLKILKGDVRIIVDKSRLTLTWYLDGKWIREYPCCVGPGEKTRAGTYTIIEREVKPAWHDPKTGRIIRYGQPDYALGTRWMGFSEDVVEGLGIHGTNEPKSVPGRVSNGCVRLLQDHVEELYGFALIGSTVVVRD